jgi:hypothetical protein
MSDNRLVGAVWIGLVLGTPSPRAEACTPVKQAPAPGYALSPVAGKTWGVDGQLLLGGSPANTSSFITVADSSDAIALVAQSSWQGSFPGQYVTYRFFTPASPLTPGVAYHLHTLPTIEPVEFVAAAETPREATLLRLRTTVLAESGELGGGDCYSGPLEGRPTAGLHGP